MAKEILQTAEEFYIVASSSRLDERTRVLKHDDTFAVFDALGDIGAYGPGDAGIYHRDTRFLSRLSLRFGECRPVLLSSTVRKDNALLSADMTNADIVVGDIIAVPKGTLHLFRTKVLWQGACYEMVRIHNYGHLPVSLPLEVGFECDFADIFEVRGMERAARGRHEEPVVDASSALLGYRGLDDRPRATRLTFAVAPDLLDDHHARYDVRVLPGDAATYEWVVRCETDEGQPAARVSFEQAAESVTRLFRAEERSEPVVRTGNELFDQWVERSLADLRMLRTQVPHGCYEYAGVPWFSTVFGRDGLITALEMLWFDPEIARGALGHLASTQADSDNPAEDAQPGKILHESRAGEMALLDEVPFRHYYGSVDSTPLFVMLAGAYHQRTGDLSFVSELWPHVLRAMAWMEEYGDADGDGFLEYERRSENGLVHQGWKDSSDPVFHADGTLVDPPIALCEVQGYRYAALLAAALLGEASGEEQAAASFRQQAEDLRARFDEAFWLADMGFYALALDARKRPCRVRTSNAGHCLYTGIASPERAARVAGALIGEGFFSGWGIRTVSTGEARYNPMSYHNGSVWPHDNALIAAGMARYGFKAHAARVLEGMFDATLSFDLHRLPELFCGFHRRPSEGPTLYPVACSPQAWASASVLLLLQSCLALEVDGVNRAVTFDRPLLPTFLQHVEIRGLRVADAVVDMELRRRDGGLELGVSRNDGGVEVSLLS